MFIGKLDSLEIKKVIKLLQICNLFIDLVNLPFVDINTWYLVNIFIFSVWSKKKSFLYLTHFLQLNGEGVDLGCLAMSHSFYQLVTLN